MSNIIITKESNVIKSFIMEVIINVAKIIIAIKTTTIIIIVVKVKSMVNSFIIK